MSIPQSPAEYQRLKTVLIEAADAAKAAAKDRDEDTYREIERHLAVRSLVAVIGFLNCDPELREAGALPLLSRIHHTFHDLQSGAQRATAKPAKQPAGRPAGVVADRVRAVLCYVLDLLVVEGGMKKDPAAAWLVSEIGKMGIRCEDGSAVTARQLSRWLSDAKCGAAPKATREVFNELTQTHGRARAKIRTWPIAARQAQAKQTAHRTLMDLNNFAPRDLPAARR